jgi:hypothetical protein
MHQHIEYTLVSIRCLYQLTTPDQYGIIYDIEIQNKVYSMRYRNKKKRNTACCAVLILYKDKKYNCYEAVQTYPQLG